MTGEPTSARLRVVSAGPLVTFQDGGRAGHMRFGVARSGPMDELAHAAANLAVGNAEDATAIEVSTAGLAVEVASGAVTVAVTGGDAVVEVSGRRVDHWNAVTLAVGDRLTVRQGEWGSWSYVAVAGDLVASSWLGHTATHSTSGLGGGAISTGDDLDVVAARVERAREGGIPVFVDLPGDAPIRVVVGPQHRHFPAAVVDTLASSGYRLTDAYDRMGVRLAGPALMPEHALSIPSEPIVRGSIQVSGDGVPTVLLADHQTTGGYPKIATVVSADLDRLVQRRAGDELRFALVSPSEAVDIARARGEAVAAYLAAVAGDGRTLTHRLRDASLVSGVVDPSE